MYFQDLIFTLQQYWVKQGCILLQPYDMEVGAATSAPSTLLRCLDTDNWNMVHVQPCRRPVDGRDAANPNRVQYYYQLQVVLKPSPHNIQDLCIESITSLGLSKELNDFRFIEDDWENPTLGAAGLGWELWCNGMEILQFTFMQQIGGIELANIDVPIPVELTYGLERLAMYLQGVESIWDIKWNEQGVTYSDIFKKSEIEYCQYNFRHSNVEQLEKLFNMYEEESGRLIEESIIQPALDYCLKAGHIFNLMEARGAISVTERTAYITRIRDKVKLCLQALAKRRG